MKNGRFLLGKGLELTGAVLTLFAFEAGALRHRVDQEYVLLGAGILVFVIGWWIEKPARA